jgi:ribosome-associated protein
MDIRKLQRAIVDGLEDVKAQNIAVFNTEHLSPLFERVIIASGTSNRQTKALAASVRETVKQRGMPVLSTEGEDNGEWIIVDCGPAVVHVMQPAIREYYRLEEIWGGKPVGLKAAAAGGLPAASFASEPVHAEAEAQASAKPAAGRKAARQRPAPDAPPGKAPAPARAAPSKPAAKPTARSGSMSTRKAAAAPSAGKATGRGAGGAAGKPATAKTSKAPARSTAKPSAKPAAARGAAAGKPASATSARKTRATTAGPRTPVRTVVAPRPRSASARPSGSAARKAGSGGRGTK